MYRFKTYSDLKKSLGEIKEYSGVSEGGGVMQIMLRFPVILSIDAEQVPPYLEMR